MRETPKTETLSFNHRLDAAMDRTGSLVCVGLDPHADLLEEPAGDFCRRIIDKTHEAAVAFKPNSAFFEARGPEGMAELKVVMDHLPPGRLMILDAKRGDIGSTARAYARAAFQVYGADALTVNPYLGRDSVEPFLKDPSRGAFLLCHTSNPGAQDFQTLEREGRPLYHDVARAAAAWNGSDNLGLVVGATYPEALEKVRELAPRLPFLVPGIGAQGGELEASLRAGLDMNGRGLLVSSSRGIIFSGDPATEAKRLRDAINNVRERMSV